MATALSLLLFGVVLVVQTLIAAVMTRYFRVRLNTRLGWIIYSALLVPLALLSTTLLFTGLLNIGPDLGEPAIVAGVLIGVPTALGMTVDVLYMAPPEEYELPDTQRG